LVGVVQNRVDDTNLPSRVLDIWTRVRTHQGGSKNNRQVRSIHSVSKRILLDPVQVESQGTQGSVIWIW
jgi:hypothetical protein